MKTAVPGRESRAMRVAVGETNSENILAVFALCNALSASADVRDTPGGISGSSINRRTKCSSLPRCLLRQAINGDTYKQEATNGARGIATRSDRTLLGARTTRSKKLLETY